MTGLDPKLLLCDGQLPGAKSNYAAQTSMLRGESSMGVFSMAHLFALGTLLSWM